MTKTPQTQPPDAEPVAHRDPVLAAFLAWLIPGLGHLYQGRWAKAVLYFVCIMGTFSYGLYLGGSDEVGWGRVVYASWRPGDRRLYYLCQIGVGLPALPAMVQTLRTHDGREPFGRFMAPPRLEGFEPPDDRLSLCELHRHLARYFELGTIYTAIAGLLNFLAVFDAWAGPVVGQPEKKEDDPTEDQATSNESES